MSFMMLHIALELNIKTNQFLILEMLVLVVFMQLKFFTLVKVVQFWKEKTYFEVNYRHNFGHKGPEKYHGIGINAKMTELQAAMGLSVLPHMDFIINEIKICTFMT